MYKHILIPTDGSPVAGKAVSAGLEFARDAKARVTIFTAVPEYQPPSEADVMSHHVVSMTEHQQRSQKAAQDILASAAEQARAAGVEFETDYAQSDYPGKAIVDAAQRHGCDAIFMASHGRTGFSRVIHGSETSEVLSHSTIPTVV